VKFKEIRQVLEKELKRLNIESGLYSMSVPSVDRAVSPLNKKFEAANQILELEQRLGKVRRIKQQMADIEHALQKLEQGTYGVCDSCKKPIASERLKAVPQASLCLECKANKNRSMLNAYSR